MEALPPPSPQRPPLSARKGFDPRSGLPSRGALLVGHTSPEAAAFAADFGAASPAMALSSPARTPRSGGFSRPFFDSDALGTPRTPLQRVAPPSQARSGQGMDLRTPPGFDMEPLHLEWNSELATPPKNSASSSTPGSADQQRAQRMSTEQSPPSGARGHHRGIVPRPCFFDEGAAPRRSPPSVTVALTDAPTSGCLTPPETPQQAYPLSPARARTPASPAPAPVSALRARAPVPFAEAPLSGGLSLCRRTSQIRLNNAPATPRSLLVLRQPALPTHMRDQALSVRPSSAPSCDHWDAPAGPMPGSPAKRTPGHRYDTADPIIVNRRLRELNGGDQGPPTKVGRGPR
jgi:hypothetical protein